MFERIRNRECVAGATLQEDLEEAPSWGRWAISRRRWLIVSGGNDGSIFKFLHPHMRALAGDYALGYRGVVRLGAGFDGCRISGASVPVGKRRIDEEDDGGHDDHAQ